MIRKRVLVVEDSDIAGKVLTNFFWFYGYDADCIRDKDKAVEALRASDYGLIVIDHPTQNIDLRKFIDLIRNLSPNIPIIGLSSGLDETELQEAGIEMVIGKPIDLRGLREAMGFFLNDPRPHP